MSGTRGPPRGRGGAGSRLAAGRRPSAMLTFSAWRSSLATRWTCCSPSPRRWRCCSGLALTAELDQAEARCSFLAASQISCAASAFNKAIARPTMMSGQAERQIAAVTRPAAMIAILCSRVELSVTQSLPSVSRWDQAFTLVASVPVLHPQVMRSVWAVLNLVDVDTVAATATLIAASTPRAASDRVPTASPRKEPRPLRRAPPRDAICRYSWRHRR